MQNNQSKNAALLVLNQNHSEKTSPTPIQASTFPGQTDQKHTGQTETPEQSGETSTQQQAGNLAPGNDQFSVQSPITTQYQFQENVQGNGQQVTEQDGQPIEYQSHGTTQENTQPFPGQNTQMQTQMPPQSTNAPDEPEEVPIPQRYDSPPQASPNADFTEVYRTGNFGTHFGRVNVKRGKQWTMVHGSLSCVMFVFTLSATIMMESYTNEVIRSILFAFTWMAAIGDLLTATAAWFLIWRLSTLRHPLSTLIVLRTSAAFSFAFNMFFFLVGLLAGLLLKEKDFISLSSGEVEALKSLYVVITILMAIKIVTSYAFVLLWWRSPTCYHALGPYCVFDEGEELAEGVANSAGALRVVAVGHAAEAVGSAMDGLY